MATRIATDTKQGLEVWQTWDEGAQVFELWASEACNDYIGCADTRAEALEVARDWFDDPDAHMWNLRREV